MPEFFRNCHIMSAIVLLALWQLLNNPEDSINRIVTAGIIVAALLLLNVHTWQVRRMYNRQTG